DGVFSEKPGCNQWHSKGIYQIPYRCLYSRNINNLFLAGRIISSSHVAFASTRVMGTSAYIGQAIGIAAYIAKDKGQVLKQPKHHIAENSRLAFKQGYLEPRDIIKKGIIGDLQQELQKSGQYIPGFVLNDKLDLVQQAKLEVSSTFSLDCLNADFSLSLDSAV